MLIDLKGKNAIVCGSTQGIGLAIAKEFAILGANVLLIARNEEKLKDVANSLEKQADQTHAYICADFHNPTALQAEINNYNLNNTEIDILVNNTGGPPAGRAIDATLDDFLNAFKQHLICNQILAQAVVAGMISRKYGRIINIISTSVKMPIPGLGVSNTIRGAVANWAKTLSIELGPYGITVNNVLPGATNTGRLDSIIENKAKKTGESTDFVRNEMISEIPAGYIGSPQDLASAVVFLASPAAGYINGINLPVDGGRTGSL
jgi:3-oxoacyl-[acyl-carrier protein] reductase